MASLHALKARKDDRVVYRCLVRVKLFQSVEFPEDEETVSGHIQLWTTRRVARNTW
jgi:hypothetical protein